MPGDWRDSPELDVLLALARKRLEANGLAIESSITVPLADPPELRRLCAGINGSSVQLSRAHKTQVHLVRFDDWLTNNGGVGLLDTLNEQTPLRDKKRLAAEKAEIKARALAGARSRLASHGEWADRWLSSLLNQDGTLGGRVAVEALGSATRVLAMLPVDGLSLTELAEQACGDTKALSSGSARKLVLDALSLREGVPRPTDPVGIRLLWETAGVSVDALSSRVVVLGYRVTEDHIVGRWLNQAAAEGVPFPLTLDMIGRGSLTNTADRIFVCENIAVVAAAARGLGSESATLVCTDGQPSAAVHKLLAGLGAGTVIHWRNDFDWPGLQMTSRAVARYRATPWRMDSESYRRALDVGESEPLKGFPTASAWDPELAQAMHESGRAVMEERLIPHLLRDLT